MEPISGARREHHDAPAEFTSAVRSLLGVRFRPEVTVDETPAPKRLAPYAFALAAEVADDAGSGRLVLLHDPAGQEAWDGTYRVVTFVRAALPPDIATDPFLLEVGWAWLIDALGDHGASYSAASGTVTRVASESFGGMAERPPSADIEIRASWTPLSADLAPHARGFGDVLTTAAGLLPLPAGVVPIPTQRGGTRR